MTLQDDVESVRTVGGMGQTGVLEFPAGAVPGEALKDPDQMRQQCATRMLDGFCTALAQHRHDRIDHWFLPRRRPGFRHEAKSYITVQS
jgi:hypothetical protein